MPNPTPTPTAMLEPEPMIDLMVVLRDHWIRIQVSPSTPEEQPAIPKPKPTIGLKDQLKRLFRRSGRP